MRPRIKKRVNILICIEGKGDGKDIHCIVQEMLRSLLIFYEICIFCSVRIESCPICTLYIIIYDTYISLNYKTF